MCPLFGFDCCSDISNSSPECSNFSVEIKQCCKIKFLTVKLLLEAKHQQFLVEHNCFEEIGWTERGKRGLDKEEKKSI